MSEKNTENVTETVADVADVAGKTMSKSGKWMMGLMAGGIGIFSTIIIVSSIGSARTAMAPSTDDGVAAIETSAPARSSSPVSPGGGSDDPAAVQRMNIEALRHDMTGMQEFNMRKMEELSRKIDEMSTIRGTDAARAAAAAAPVELPPLMRPARPNERFTGEYQSKVNHFKSNRNTGWAMGDAEVRGVIERSAAPRTIATSAGSGLDVSSPVEVPVVVRPNEYIIPAGSRIIAITEQPVNSDHPGFFTSRIIRPEVLRGAHLICQNGGQMNGRIPVQVTKVILRDAEYSVSGQIEMGFPGMTGRIKRHYFGRAVPIVANAAITGGFMAWSANNRGSDRIDTRDAITAEIVSQTMPQIQGEIAKFGVDRPPTVEVATGTQFSILLTSPLTVRF